MPNPEASILIPNYRTPDITKLCLRLIRKHTDLARIRVIVIDNDSGDESTRYLRGLEWIDLIERRPQPDDTPPLSHSRALDLALQQATTPYVLSFHTDTFVRDNGWLDFLLSQIRASDSIAGVGSWKLESKPPYKRLLKWLESRSQSALYHLTGRDRSKLEGTRHHFRYLRSHCALYRMDLIRQLGLTFSAENDTAGKVMHRSLTDAGYEMVFLPSEILSRYLLHLNHATMVLNPELGSADRSIRKGLKRVKQTLDELNAEAILQDESLDQVFTSSSH